MYSNYKMNIKPESAISGSYDGFSYPFGRLGLANYGGLDLPAKKDCSTPISSKAIYKKSAYKLHSNFNNLQQSDLCCNLLSKENNSQNGECVFKNNNENGCFIQQQRFNQYNGMSSLPPMDLTHQKGSTHTKDTQNNMKKFPDGRNQQYEAQYHTSPLHNNISYSSDEHYQSYCSYYYQRQPEFYLKNRQTNRRFISKLMASAKNYVDETTDKNVKVSIRQTHDTGNCKIIYSHSKYGNEAINAQYSAQVKINVLTERIPNNNSILQYMDDRKEQLAEKNEIDYQVSNYKNSPIFVYDNIELCDASDNFKNAEINSLMEKRSYTKINASNAFDLECNSWINVTNNNDIISEQSPPLPKSQHSPVQGNTYLSKTPQKKRTHSASKQSPPSHRVLLYGNQSPRLNRISPINRLQDRTKMYLKSPEIKTKESKNAQGEKKDDIKCYVRLMKPLQPVRCNAGSDISDNFNRNDDNDDNYGDLTDDDSHIDSCESDQSSDSENGYRAYAYKLTHSLDPTDESQTCTMPETLNEHFRNPISLLVPSLFPNVPPYIAFSSHTQKGPDVSPDLYRILKWKVTNVMPKVVRSVLTNSGMRLLKKTNDWMGTWGKHMKSPCFKTIRPYQKINHLPGSFKIGRKDSCWKNLQKQICKYGKKDFGFMPKTYIIPHDLNSLRRNWPRYSQRNVKWIIKPPASARGTGIRVVDRWAQIPKRRPLIVQKYIERPLLINGSKFDLRLYVLVTSINPLRVYMYHNGLARFASVKYSDKSDTLNDRCMHLTNYSINKLSLNYSKNEDVNACHGHKWTIKSLWTYLSNRGIRTDCLWEALRNLVLRTILAGEYSINNMVKTNVESKYSCFELFGFDVLLDADLIPWLLEVNISPSLHSELPLDAHVKAPLVQGVLNTALYNVPPKLSLDKQKEISVSMSLPPGPICYDKRMYINYLSRAEKIKHNTFTRKSLDDKDEYVNEILENLTPDDIRCLIVAEDELARSAPLERIFPTNKTHKYLKYTESPRYYNRLLDAWETRYGNNRNEGIELLCRFCEDKYHLEIPPSPVKKHIKYRTRTIVAKRNSNLKVATVISIVPKWKKQSFVYRLNQWWKQGETEKLLLDETKEEVSYP